MVRGCPCKRWRAAFPTWWIFKAWLTELVLTPGFVSGDLWGFFHASHIATDIRGAITVDQDELGSNAHSYLTRQRFDQAPVVSQGRTVGWVLTSRLPEGDAVNSVMTRLDNSAIISAESSIPRVLQLLGRHNFCSLRTQMVSQGLSSPVTSIVMQSAATSTCLLPGSKCSYRR